MKRLDSEHVLSIIDTGWLPDGRLWLTMPVVEGGTLRSRLQAERPSDAQAREWMVQMLKALAALHSCEPAIIHRDIKPSNFLVREDKSLALTDIGIALQAHHARLTRTMEQMGSTAFMSPEQQAGARSPPPQTSTAWAWSSTSCSQARTRCWCRVRASKASWAIWSGL